MDEAEGGGLNGRGWGCYRGFFRIETKEETRRHVNDLGAMRLGERCEGRDEAMRQGGGDKGDKSATNTTRWLMRRGGALPERTSAQGQGLTL